MASTPVSRGKTTPDSTAGSFAPAGQGATSSTLTQTAKYGGQTPDVREFVDVNGDRFTAEISYEHANSRGRGYTVMTPSGKEISEEWSARFQQEMEKAGYQLPIGQATVMVSDLGESRDSAVIHSILAASGQIDPDGIPELSSPATGDGASLLGAGVSTTGAVITNRKGLTPEAFNVSSYVPEGKGTVVLAHNLRSTDPKDSEYQVAYLEARARGLHELETDRWFQKPAPSHTNAGSAGAWARGNQAAVNEWEFIRSQAQGKQIPVDVSTPRGVFRVKVVEDLGGTGSSHLYRGIANDDNADFDYLEFHTSAIQ